MFVNLWKSAPFLRLILPLISGAITGLYVPALPWMLLIVCCAGWMLPAFLSITWRFRLRYWRGAFVTGSVFCLGMGLVYHHDIRHRADWFGHAAEDTSLLTVVLQEAPVKKPNSWKAEAMVTGIHVKGKPATGKIILYFREAPPLRYGDRILLRAEAQKIRGTGNPGAFDYSKYCSYRNLYHQTFLRPSQWQKLPGNEGQAMERWLITARDYCLRTLKTYIPHREEYGVAQALLIGYRDELDKEIVQAYTNTGVVHIIAISGLHLGLIYITLLQLMSWLPDRRGPNSCKALILIAVLWAFSLLTGASASVLRSAVMFTTIAVGQLMIARHSSTYNTLAAAAFLLLCYNPYFLLDAGFQLSFLAVAGILLCYKPVYDSWMLRNKWLDKVWQMVAVSLAAQVFTWPVCLFYFRQFPNLFLLANLVAVPLSTLLLYGEILLVAVPWIGGIAGPLLQWGIRAMNTIIQWIDMVPGAVTNNIYISFAQMFCLYGITLAGCAWWLLRWKAGCWWVLTAGLVYTGLGTLHRLEVMAQRKLIVYNIPRKTVFEYMHGSESVLVGDTVADMEKYTGPAHLVNGVKTTRHTVPFPNILLRPQAFFLTDTSLILQAAPGANISLPPPAAFTSPATQGAPANAYQRKAGRPALINLHGKRLLFWQGLLPATLPREKIKVDYILLSHPSGIDIHRFDDFFIYEIIIFDASASAFLLRKWKSDCNKLPLRCFSVPDEGAFVVNL